MNNLTIRRLQFSDFEAWHPLWVLNNEGQITDQITKHTWRNITNKNYSVYGLCAEEDSDMIGILHFIIHPVTGSLSPVCYMQDLFIHPDHRRKGIAQALLEELNAIGQQEKWNRIYWLAEHKNIAAQKLYENIGVKLDFSLHVLPLGILKK